MKGSMVAAFTVADGCDLGGTVYAETYQVIGLRAQVAVGVDDFDRYKRHVHTVGRDRVAVGGQPYGGGGRPPCAQ